MSNVMVCPECKRVSSVAEWCTRPICVHHYQSNTPEIWDGDNVDGEGGLIEQSREPRWRTPGPDTWTEMVPQNQGRCEVEDDNGGVCGEPILVGKVCYDHAKRGPGDQPMCPITGAYLKWPPTDIQQGEIHVADAYRVTDNLWFSVTPELVEQYSDWSDSVQFRFEDNGDGTVTLWFKKEA